jgi:hypothetical protein
MFLTNANVIGIILKHDTLISIEYYRMQFSVIKLVCELPINSDEGTVGTWYILPPSSIEASTFIKKGGN